MKKILVVGIFLMSISIFAQLPQVVCSDFPIKTPDEINKSINNKIDNLIKNIGSTELKREQLTLSELQFLGNSNIVCVIVTQK